MPPHTAASLMRAICIVENILYQDEPKLYLSVESHSHIIDSTRMSLLEEGGPGDDEKNPLVLVISLRVASGRSAALPDLSRTGGHLHI